MFETLILKKSFPNKIKKRAFVIRSVVNQFFVFSVNDSIRLWYMQIFTTMTNEREMAGAFKRSLAALSVIINSCKSNVGDNLPRLLQRLYRINSLVAAGGGLIDGFV